MAAENSLSVPSRPRWEREYAPRIVLFNWTGFDEGDEVSGSGSAELTEDDDTILEIELSFHNGDDAVLKACRF